jgi:hypothetical protein
MVVGHDYIHVGNGAMYCQTCEVLVTEQDGAAAVRDMKEHEREATTMVVDQRLKDAITKAIQDAPIPDDMGGTWHLFIPDADVVAEAVFGVLERFLHESA